VLYNFKDYELISELIKTNIIQLGFKGFMADFGEYTPLDAVATNSPDLYQFHNQLPVLWASTVRYILVIKILM